MARAVIVGGARTPFVRAFAEYTRIDTIALGVAAVRGALDRLSLPHDEIDSVVWGGVILPVASPNVGREIVLDLGLPRSIEAMTLTRACASGLQAITTAASAIERGDADVVIAGGSDSTSNAPLTMPQSLVHKVAPVALSSKSGPADYLRALSKLSVRRDLLPRQPRIAERTTGQVMGEAAEEMAERNGISRAEQDAFAATSHHRAAAAIQSGRFEGELVPVEGGGGLVYTDTIVRGDTSVEKLSKLRPVFKEDGTLTAGNSSALTDGAAAVVLMSEDKAKALGYTPLASFRSWSYVGVDPADQLLIGPALAMPRALGRAGMLLRDVDLVDMHEAFAAQVLSVLKAMASDSFCRERLDLDQAVGQVDPEKLNVHGGSVALGHPFGATGARMVLTMANELAANDKSTALLGICAAGGLGAGAVLEAVG
ncbi:MAG TPA: acetyl-CoA C-acyltransferase [Deltaproteobacteria bacterium]|nr:acetyl-CoA C-acyltransferase [Deltaproteobacteria bacterium]